MTPAATAATKYDENPTPTTAAREATPPPVAQPAAKATSSDQPPTLTLTHAQAPPSSASAARVVSEDLGARTIDVRREVVM